MPPQQRARGVADEIKSEAAYPKEKQNPSTNVPTNARGRRNPNGAKASNVLPAEPESPFACQEGPNGVGILLRQLHFVLKTGANFSCLDRLDCNGCLDFKHLPPDAPFTRTSYLRMFF